MRSCITLCFSATCLDFLGVCNGCEHAITLLSSWGFLIFLETSPPLTLLLSSGKIQAWERLADGHVDTMIGLEWHRPGRCDGKRNHNATIPKGGYIKRRASSAQAGSSFDPIAVVSCTAPPTYILCIYVSPHTSTVPSPNSSHQTFPLPLGGQFATGSELT